MTVYHGTDNISAASIRSGINRGAFRPRSDFGAGFYLTTVPHQARQWANQRARRTRVASAELLEFEMSRNAIESLRHMAFTTDSTDYYDFITYCRAGLPLHGPRRAQTYDIVYGPVSLWPQTLVLANCDQIMLTDPTALGLGFRYNGTITPAPQGRFF